jgi:hypothetical protein
VAVDPVDHIILNGTTLLCDGVQAGKSVSEFTSGLKIGRATYDDRQHAFYTVLEDFSGGFGHRQLDIREALGTHWDNPGGVDLRRSRHITLPPKRYVVSPDNEPTNKLSLSSGVMDGAAIGITRADRGAGFSSWYYYGAGDTVYRMDSDRDSLVRAQLFDYDGGGGLVSGSADNEPAKTTRLFLFRAPGSPVGTRRLYLVTVNDNPLGSTSKYFYTNDPDAASPTWVEGTKALWDAIVAPVGDEGANLVIAQDINMYFMYSADPTNGGTDWNVDEASAAINPPIWQPHGVCRFLGVATHPQTPVAAVYFLDYGDGRLYALNYAIRKATPVNIGDYHYLVNGVIWQGNIVVTDGWDIWLYTPGGGGTETVRKIGLWGRDGVPDSLRDGRYRITGFVDGGDQLFAVAERTALGKIIAAGATLGFVIFAYNGAGWSQFMEKQEAIASSTTVAVNPIAAIIDRYPIGVIAAAEMQQSTSRALNVLCQMHPGAAKKVRLHSFRLPQIGTIPIDGVDEFDDPGSGGFRVGWIDGGFRDIQGSLYYVKVDLQECLAGSKVEVSYRLDDDESGAFTILGTASVRGTPDANIFQFDAADEAGVEFRTVQFKIRVWRDGATQLDGAISVTTAGTFDVDDTTGWPDTGLVEIDNEAMEYSSITSTSFTVAANADRGIRGTDAATHTDGTKVNVLNRTPELRAITLVYSKKSKLRKTWVVMVDVDKMIEQKTQVDTDDDGTPDANASHQNVWDLLETIWDKQTLVKLVLPEMEPTGDNVRVQIADMVYAQDDNRATTTVTGRINLTLIQPVRA